MSCFLDKLSKLSLDMLHKPDGYKNCADSTVCTQQQQSKATFAEENTLMYFMRQIHETNTVFKKYIFIETIHSAFLTK